MDELKQLTHDIWDELMGARHYAELSMKHRDTDATAAHMYADMARAEMGHAENLMKEADRTVSAHKAKNMEHGKMLELVWNWEKDKLHDHFAKTKSLVEMAK